MPLEDYNRSQEEEKEDRLAAEAEAKKEKEKEDPEVKKQAEDKKAKEGLTDLEYKQFKKGKSLDEFLSEKRNIQIEAENRLRRLDANKDITLKEDKGWRHRLETTISPAEARLVLQEIEQKEIDLKTEGAENKDKSKELPPEDPELLKLEQEFIDICKEHEHIIGKKDMDSWIEWIKDERRKKPTIMHMETQISKLKGDIPSSEGLQPRIEFYENTLQPIYEKYDMRSPMVSEFIQQYGTSDRVKFIKQAKEVEDRLQLMKNSGFCSQEVMKEEMQVMLGKTDVPGYPRSATCDSLVKQKERLQMIINTAKVEQEEQFHFNRKTTIKGKDGSTHTMRTTSEASKIRALKYQSSLAFGVKVHGSTRMEGALNWKNFIDEEEKIAFKLEEALENHPEFLEKATKSFEGLAFEDKEKLVKEYEKTAEDTNAKEKLSALTTIADAISAIQAAENKGYVSESTAGKYKAIFELKNYENPDTERPDLLQLEDDFKTLTSQKAITSREKRNLKAYEDSHINFSLALKQRAKYDIEFSEDAHQKALKEFESMGWEKRQTAHKDLIKTINEKRQDKEKADKLDKAAGVDAAQENKDSKESAEALPGLEKTMELLQEMLDENTEDSISTGVNMAAAYRMANPKVRANQDFMKLYSQLVDAEYKLGIQGQEQEDKTLEDEIAQDIAAEASTADNQNKLEQAAIGDKITEEVKNQQRLQNKTDQHDRMTKQRLKEAGSEEEKDMIRDISQKSQEQDQGRVGINEEGKAEIAEEYRIDQENMTTEDQQKLRNAIAKSKTDITKNKGMNTAVLKKDGTQAKMEGEGEAKQAAKSEQGDKKIAEKGLSRFRKKRSIMSAFRQKRPDAQSSGGQALEESLALKAARQEREKAAKKLEQRRAA